MAAATFQRVKPHFHTSSSSVQVHKFPMLNEAGSSDNTNNGKLVPGIRAMGGFTLGPVALH